MKTRITLIALGTLLTIAGCSSNKGNVMRGENGIYTASAYAQEETKALDVAVDQANDYCEDDDDKRATFVGEESKYSGSVPKGAHRTISRIPGVGSILTTGEDFQAIVRFRCE